MKHRNITESTEYLISHRRNGVVLLCLLECNGDVDKAQILLSMCCMAIEGSMQELESDGSIASFAKMCFVTYQQACRNLKKLKDKSIIDSYNSQKTWYGNTKKRLAQ